MVTGEISAIVSALLWALTTVLVRMQAERIDAWSMSALRCLIAAAGMLAIWPLAPKGAVEAPDAILPAATLYLIPAVFFGAGFGDTIYFKAAERIGVSRALPIASTYPLFTSALAIPLFGEDVSVHMASGIALCVAGVALLAQHPGRAKAKQVTTDTDMSGLWLALLAALSWSLPALFLKLALASIDFWTANAIRMVFAAAIAGLLARLPGHERHVRMTGRRDVLMLIATGINTGVITLTFIFAIQLAGAARASALSATAPLFAVPVSSLLLREPITRLTVSGALLTVLGIWLVL